MVGLGSRCQKYKNQICGQAYLQIGYGSRYWLLGGNENECEQAH